jgi:choline-sulfatase
MTMIRLGQWKFVHYVGQRPQLFDLQADPLETRDLGTDPALASVRQRCETVLRSIIDPEQADRNAFADQRVTIERNGGAAACLAQGDMHYSPIPGERAMA